MPNFSPHVFIKVTDQILQVRSSLSPVFLFLCLLMCNARDRCCGVRWGCLGVFARSYFSFIPTLEKKIIWEQADKDLMGKDVP